ncbi:endonuclease/exonuclease/phosphatase family protein [Shewanella sedimentimangrovi]|uniref:Endonuclease/exonuclease/phosphatase family protein n=1 Tax=Shewanella sedimentimangrovi TaxID=2814293 RepID=A0ABX7R2H5_9GAMM|nr:endonuclease/exonuclease/phosphatase family protein [Shewanella sedimentimangrovi]QSX37273.1 endonuclease/exonuclease/phosphatase family protein [Shewanella sedimentimangrovi]
MKRWIAIILLAMVTMLALLRPEIAGESLPRTSFNWDEEQGNCIRAGSAKGSLDRRGQLSLLVWNIHKQQDGAWPGALWFDPEPKADLLLLQEVRAEPVLLSALEDQHYTWQYMVAFKLRGQGFGVMSAARSKTSVVCGWLATEPWIRIPKSALLSLYPLSNGQELLALNLHGINFDFGLAAWQAQIEELISASAEHQGPLIFAGDFNSWGDRRSAWLRQTMAALGLKELSFNPDNRVLGFNTPLDHLFYRDLHLERAYAPPSTWSDHAPLLATFSLITESD